MQSCNNENVFPSSGKLISLIGRAESLLQSTEEGQNEGDFAPGSQKQLQTRVDWANYILETAENNEAIDNAYEILNSEIEIYKLNVVKAGYPSLSNGSEIDLGKNSEYDIQSKFTIKYRVRFKDLTGNNLFSGEDTGGGIITRYAGGTVQAYVHNGGWVGGNVDFNFEPQKWYNIAFVYDGQSSKFYVDGKICMDIKGMKAPVNIKPETHLKFGAHPTYGGRWFSGEICQVSIWSKAKNSADVLSELNTEYSGEEDGLLAYWPMNLNLGSVILDKTGKHTAVGNNIVWVDVE